MKTSLAVQGNVVLFFSKIKFRVTKEQKYYQRKEQIVIYWGSTYMKKCIALLSDKYGTHFIAVIMKNFWCKTVITLAIFLAPVLQQYLLQDPLFK